MLRCVIVFSFLIFVQSLYAQKSFENLSEERATLLEIYKTKPKKSTRVKINRLEAQILEAIETNGYAVTVNTMMGLEVHDKAYPVKGAIIATLEDQQEILILDKDAYGFYKIKVNDQVGYVYNLQTTPSMEEYPLNLINESLEQQKVIDDITSSPSIFRIRYECPSVECGANTHAGKPCKVITTNCKGNCHLH